jgi:hypothetical protein
VDDEGRTHVRKKKDSRFDRNQGCKAKAEDSDEG